MSNRKSTTDPLGLSFLESMRQADMGLGIAGSLNKGLLASMRQADMGLGIAGSLNKGLLESIRQAGMGFGIAGSLNKGLLASMRQADMGFGIAGSLNKGVLASMRQAGMGLGIAGSVDKGLLESMRKADMGLGAFGAAQKSLADSIRKVDAGLGAVGGMHKTIVESIRLAGMGMGIIDDASQAWAKSSSAIAKFAREQYALGALGGAIAAVGLTGRFDDTLMNAAVAAARFFEDDPTRDPDEVETARAQSVLLDTVAEVEAFASQHATASFEDIQKQVAITLDTIASKLADRLASAKPVERVSIMNLLGLLITLISTIAAVYYGQVAKDAADGSTADAVELRTTISRANEQQLDEVRKLRASVDKLAESVADVDSDDVGKLWVVERSADVRSRKTTKAAKVAQLHPNQVVSAIQIEHKWVRVEYYDYLTDTLKTGWVLKKYMRRLPHKASAGSNRRLPNPGLELTATFAACAAVPRTCFRMSAAHHHVQRVTLAIYPPCEQQEAIVAGRKAVAGPPCHWTCCPDESPIARHEAPFRTRPSEHHQDDIAFRSPFETSDRARVRSYERVAARKDWSTEVDTARTPAEGASRTLPRQTRASRSSWFPERAGSPTCEVRLTWVHGIDFAAKHIDVLDICARFAEERVPNGQSSATSFGNTTTEIACRSWSGSSPFAQTATE
jgi:hypothetical protein